MRKTNPITLLRIDMTLAVALVACVVATGQDVRHNYMPGTDFSKYHTYKWVNIEGGAHSNQIVDAEIKQSLDAQMTSKGFSKTDNDKADLYLGYQIAVDQAKQWNGYGMGGGVRSRGNPSSVVHLLWDKGLPVEELNRLTVSTTSRCCSGRSS